MHLALIGPPPSTSATPSYAGRLAPALRALGHTVDLVDATAEFRLPAGARPVVDALVLPRLAVRMDELVVRGAAGLVHHPGAHVVYDNGAPGAERELLAALPRLVASSTPVETRLRETYGIPAERIHVVEPGLDALPRSTGSTSGCAVLSVGVLAPRKGFDKLAAALRRLFDLDWTLTIAGDAGRDPGYEASLEEVADGRVRLLRDPAPEALEAVWRGADVFALATRWEGYPSATAEAVCRGLPVVTTDGGGAARPVPEAGGSICPVDDAATLSKTLRRVIFDVALRREMADAAWDAGQALPGWDTQAALFAAALSDTGLEA